RIRRFTPMAEKMLNLIPADIGRPIADIRLNLAIDDLETQLAEVIDTVTVREMEVQDSKGHWYMLRLRPYKTLENQIDGAVLLLVDVDSIKTADNALIESEVRFRLLADSAPVLIWVNNLKGREFVNRAYREFVGADETKLKDKGWVEFLHPKDRKQYLE